MKPSEALRRHREEIRRIVESGNAANPRVFGSVLYGRDTEASDLDILVDPTQVTTMFDIGTIRYRLRDLLAVSVDVLTPKALHENMRDAVLSEARPI
ncbi:MAG: nucleotidyltransferase domain-containing protein [Acidobacteriaceae bacterium]